MAEGLVAGEERQDTGGEEPTNMGDFMNREYPAEPEGGGDGGDDNPGGGDGGDGGDGGGGASLAGADGGADVADEGDPDSLPPELQAGYVAPDADPDANHDGDELAEVDSIIEDASVKGDIRTNMRNMRNMIGAKNEKIGNLEALVASAKEAGLINDDGTLGSAADPDATGRLNAAYDRIAKYDLSSDPRFNDRYQVPIDREVEAFAVTVADSLEGGKEAGVALAHELFNMPVQQRELAIRERVPDVSNHAASHIIALERLVGEKNYALQSHSDTQTRLNAEGVASEAKRVTELKAALHTQAIGNLVADGIGIFAHVPGNPTYNKWVDDRIAEVEDLFNTTDIGVQAEALALSRAAPIYKQMYESQMQMNADLKAELSQYKTVVPRAKGSRAPASSAPGGMNSDSNASIAQFLANKSAAR